MPLALLAAAKAPSKSTERFLDDDAPPFLSGAQQSASITFGSKQRPADDAIQPALALIDISSQSPVEWQVAQRIARGRLSQSWKWFVTPPVGVTLDDGIVKEIATSFQPLLLHSRAVDRRLSWYAGK